MKRGATLIELIITILIIAIISSVSAGIIVSLMQLFVYLPREMKARSIAHEAMDIMLEGEPQKRGMRYAVQIVDASSTQFTCTFGYPSSQDKRNMRFRWDSTQGKLYRSYTAFGGSTYGPEEVMPYYATAEISITGRQTNPTTIFTYFTDSSPWSSGNVNDIKRVEINIAISTGTGLFQNWDSSFETTSSIEIKQYI